MGQSLLGDMCAKLRMIEDTFSQNGFSFDTIYQEGKDTKVSRALTAAALLNTWVFFLALPSRIRADTLPLPSINHKTQHGLTTTMTMGLRGCLLSSRPPIVEAGTSSRFSASGRRKERERRKRGRSSSISILECWPCPASDYEHQNELPI